MGGHREGCREAEEAREEGSAEVAQGEAEREAGRQEDLVRGLTGRETAVSQPADDRLEHPCVNPRERGRLLVSPDGSSSRAWPMPGTTIHVKSCPARIGSSDSTQSCVGTFGSAAP